MATREEIERLKHNWVMDSCWDLEDTEGFEDHREELLDYRHRMEARWAEQKQARLEADPVYQATQHLAEAGEARDHGWPESMDYHLRVAQVYATLAIVDRLEQ